MAADGNSNVESCIHDPNFAIICSFFEQFSSSCGIKGPTFVELQRMVDSGSEIPPELIDLHIRLLRKAKKNVNPDRWQRTLSKFCYFQLPEDCWELEQKGYENLNHAQRLRILLALIGAQFDYNVKFKTDVNKLNVNDLRLNPFGKDKDGNNYWVHVDEELNLKVYKEDLDEEKWELIVTDRAGLEDLINDLMKGKDPNRKLEEIENDEESDSSDEEEKEQEQDEGLDEKYGNSETNAKGESNDDKTVSNKDISSRSSKSVGMTALKSNHLLAEAKKILAQNRPVVTYSKKLNHQKPSSTNVDVPVKSPAAVDVISLPYGKVTITKSSLVPNKRKNFVGSAASHPMALDKEQFAQHLQQLASQDMLLPLLNDDGTPDTVDELKTIISAKLNKNVDVRKAKDFITRTADILKPKLQQFGDSIKDKIVESKRIKLDDEEEIEEPLMVVTGTGSGHDCDTGNENDGEKTEPTSTSTVVSHKMDDILKNSDQTEHSEDPMPTSSVDVEKKKPKLWTIDAICSSDTKETKLSRSDDDVSFFPNYSFNRDTKKENSLFRNASAKEYSSVFGFSNESNENAVTTVPTNFYFGSNNQNPCFLPTTIVPESRVSNFTSLTKSHNVKDIVDNLDDEEKVKSSNFRVENLCTGVQGAFDLCVRKEEVNITYVKNLEKTEDVNQIDVTEISTKIEAEKHDVEMKQNNARLMKDEMTIQNRDQCSEVKHELKNEFQLKNDGRIETEPESSVAVDLRSGNNVNKEFELEVELDEESNLENNNLNDSCESNEVESLKPENDVIERLESKDDEQMHQQAEKPFEYKSRSTDHVEKPPNDEVVAETQQTEDYTENEPTFNSQLEKTIESKDEIANEVDHTDFQNKQEPVSHTISTMEDKQMPTDELETEVIHNNNCITPVKLKSDGVDESTKLAENVKSDIISIRENESVKDEILKNDAIIADKNSEGILERKMEIKDYSLNRCDKITIESNETQKNITQQNVDKLQSTTTLPVKTESEELNKSPNLDVVSDSVELTIDAADRKEMSEYREIVGELETNQDDSCSAPQEFAKTPDNDRSDVYVQEGLDKQTDEKEPVEIANNDVKVDRTDESSSPSAKSPCNETAPIDEETPIKSKDTEKSELAEPKISESIEKRTPTENVCCGEPVTNTIVDVTKLKLKVKSAIEPIEPIEPLKQDESMDEEKRKSKSDAVVERRSTRSLRSSQTQNLPVESSSLVKTPSSKKNANQEKTDIQNNTKLLQKEEKKEIEIPKKARGGWPKGKSRSKAVAKPKIKEELPLEENKVEEVGENSNEVKQMTAKVKGRPSKSGGKLKLEESDEEKQEKNAMNKVTKDETENEENYKAEEKEAKPKDAIKKKTFKRGWFDEVDLSNIDTSDSGTPGIRQSRRIAQLKIKEQAEIKYLEPTPIPKKGSTSQKSKTNLSTKKGVKTPTKKWSKSYKPPKEDSDDGSLDEKTTLKKKKKKKDVKKKFDVKNAWKASSDSSSEEEEEEEEEHFEEEEELAVNETSDHEFSPESDIDNDKDYTPVKRARTALPKPSDKDTSALDNLDCQSCNKADQPEWILLCDACDEGWHAACLKPPLMSIPEGDWFCPPCQHNKLISNLQRFMKTYDKNMKKRRNEQLRKKRLEFVGISHSNIIDELKSTIVSSSIKNEETDSSSGEYTDEESEEEPLYQLRVRRQANVSHRLNEYDEIMNSAIQREDGAALVEEVSAISESISEVADDQQMTKNAEAVLKNANEDEEKSADDDNDEENESNKDETEEASKEDEEAPLVSHLRNIRKKPARLTELDVSSEDDHYSDEDFKESSNEPDDDDEYGKSESDSEDDVPVRRSTRARRKRYDEDFINDDSEDEKDEQEQKKKKRRRSVYLESDSEEDDLTWGQQKKNKRSKLWKSPQRKRKRIMFTNESDDDHKKTKKSRVRYGLEEDSSDEYPLQRTRGKKINYTDDLESESDEEFQTTSTQRRQAKKIISDEEDDEYVNDEEEEENDEGSDKEDEADESKMSESDAKTTPESKSIKPTSIEVLPLKTNGPTAPRQPNTNVAVITEASSSNLQSVPKLESQALSLPVRIPSQELEPTNVSLESMQSMTQNLTASVNPVPPGYVPVQPMQIPSVQEIKFPPPGAMIRPPVSVNYAEYPDPQHQRLQIQRIEDDKFARTPSKLYPIPEHRQQQPSLTPMHLQQQTQQRVLGQPLPPYGALQQIPQPSMMPSPGSQMLMPRTLGNTMPVMRGSPPPQMRVRPPLPLQVPALPTLERRSPISTQGQLSSVRHVGPLVTAINAPVPAICTPPTGENKRGKRGRGKKTLEKERLEREALEASCAAVVGSDKTASGHMLKISPGDVNTAGSRSPSVTFAVSSTSSQQPFPVYSNGQRMPFTQQAPVQTAAVTVTVGNNANAKRVKITPTRMRMPNVSQHFPQPQSPSATGSSFSLDPSLPPVTASGDVKSGLVSVSATPTTSTSEAIPSKLEPPPEQYSRPASSFAPNQIPRSFNQRPEFTYVRNPMPPMYQGSASVPITQPKIGFNRPPYSNSPGPIPTSMNSTSAPSKLSETPQVTHSQPYPTMYTPSTIAVTPSTTANPPTPVYQPLHYKQLPPTGTPQSSASGIAYTQTPYYSVPSPYPSQLPPVSSFRGSGPPSIAYKPSNTPPSVRPAEYVPPPPRPSSQSVGFQYSESNRDTNETFNQSSSFARENERTTETNSDENAEPNSEETTTGEFGGLVSYFSSQRENDLDS